jgi:hypothetical protein
MSRQIDDGRSGRNRKTLISSPLSWRGRPYITIMPYSSEAGHDGAYSKNLKTSLGVFSAHGLPRCKSHA